MSALEQQHSVNGSFDASQLSRPAGESISFPNSTSRDSRIHSIYEKYLYDPKDLRSADPKIRELARKASKGERSELTRGQDSAFGNGSTSSNASVIPSPLSSSSFNAIDQQQQQQAPTTSRKKPTTTRGGGVGFATGTKEDDGAVGSGIPRGSTGSAYDGFANLTKDFWDDSDSDDDEKAQRRNGSSSQNNVRDSWGSRAMAVGDRPPDSASQNPPSLKLLGLKSARERGAPIGQSPRRASPSPAFEMMAAEPQRTSKSISAARFPPAQRRPEVEHSMSEYDDDSSRVGSAIDFPGAAHLSSHSDFLGMVGSPVAPRPSTLSTQVYPPPSPTPATHASNQIPLAARKALTAQLGLDTPLPPAPQSEQRQSGYFSSPQKGQAEVPRSDSEGSSRFQHVDFPLPPPNAVVRSSPVKDADTSGDPFGGGSPSSMRSGNGRNLVPTPRGPPSIASSSGTPPRNRPFVHGPSGGSPPKFNLVQDRQNTIPPPQAVIVGDDYFTRASPMPSQAQQTAPVRGFSDSRGEQPARQSMLRRSVAFVSGTNGDKVSQSGHGRTPSSSSQMQRKPSLLRRSVAFLTGKPIEQPAEAPVQQEAKEPQGFDEDAEGDDADDCDAPPPRVRGFVPDEKHQYDHSRRSLFLGGGAVGDEWDANGAGANFWKRFNAAQQHSQPGQEDFKTSQTYQKKVYTSRKWAKIGAGVAGILIVAMVIAIVVWRESVSDDDSTPSAAYQGDHGASLGQRSVPTAAVVLGDRQDLTEQDVWARAAVAGSSAATVERAVMKRRHARIHRQKEAA